MDNVRDITSEVQSIVGRQIAAMLEDEGQRLKNLIQYEYVIANMELASSWRMHGYDFKMMPQAFIEHINVTPVATEADRYSLVVTVEPESFKEEPKDKVDFFQKYVVENAMQKLRSKIGVS